MNYWMIEECNFSEFHEPLFQLIKYEKGYLVIYVSISPKNNFIMKGGEKFCMSMASIMVCPP